MPMFSGAWIRRVSGGCLAVILAAGGSGAMVDRSADAAAFDVIVTTLSDDPSEGLTLREAVELVNNNAREDERILFDPGLAGTVTLSGSGLVLTEPVLTIEATSSVTVAVDSVVGAVFDAQGDVLRLVGFTIDGGGMAAGVTAAQADGSLTVEEMTFVDSVGAVAVSGSDVTIVDTIVQSSQGAPAIGVSNAGRVGISEVSITGSGEEALVVDDASSVSVQDVSVVAAGGDVAVSIDSIASDARLEAVTVAQSTGGAISMSNVLGTAWVARSTVDGFADARPLAPAGISMDAVDRAYIVGTTIRNGGSTGLDVRNSRATVVEGSVVEQTVSSVGPAGMVVDGDGVSIVGSRLEANESPGFDIVSVSGAEGSWVDFDSSSFIGNVGSNVLAARGVDVDDVSISGSSFVSNDVSRAVVSIEGRRATIERSTFVGNELGDAVVSATDAPVVVLDSTLTRNAGSSAHLFSSSGTSPIDVEGSIVTDNAVDGIVDSSSPFSLVDSAVPSSEVGFVDGNFVIDDPELLDASGEPPVLFPERRSPVIDRLPFRSDPPPTDAGAGRDIGAVERRFIPSFVPLEPARLVDTRIGGTTIDGRYAGIGVRSRRSTNIFELLGRGGLPENSDPRSVKAYVLNVTAVNPREAGYITAQGCFVGLGSAASLNYEAGVTAGSELVVAAKGGDGEVCLPNTGATDIVVDVVGYVPGEASPFGNRGNWPVRLLDSRPDGRTFDGRYSGGGPFEDGQTIRLAVGDGRLDIASTSTNVVVNVTAVKPTTEGYVTVYPCGELPLASSLNFQPGRNRGNEVIAELTDTGDFCLFVRGSTHLTVDIASYLSNTGIEVEFESVVPARLLETRAGTGTIDGGAAAIGRLAAGTTTRLRVAGRGGLSDDIAGVIANLTVIRPSQRGFLTAWPCDREQPLASSLNYEPGDVIGNEVLLRVSETGDLCIFNSAETDLTVDAVGAVFVNE